MGKKNFTFNYIYFFLFLSFLVFFSVSNIFLSDSNIVRAKIYFLLHAFVQPEYPAAALAFRNARNSIISDPQDSGLRVVLNAFVPWRRMYVSNQPVETAPNDAIARLHWSGLGVSGCI